MPARPNIVIFNPDQWRGDSLGHMGHPAAITPNLDRMAETDGVSFRWAFCQNTVCTPSRCSFMTGWYPHTRGHRTMHYMLHDDEPNLLKRLKQEGYDVWWGGKNDLLPGQYDCWHADAATIKFKPSPSARPIWASDIRDQWRGKPDGDAYYSFFVGQLDTGGEPIYRDQDWLNALGAVDFVRSRKPGDAPFCLYLPLTYPHPPYAVEDPWFSAIDRSAVPDPAPVPEWSTKPSILKGIWERQNMQSWTPERWRELRAVYLAMCARVDHQFGLLMDALREAGLYDETAVFFFSDHGDFTGDYGLVEKTQNTFEDGLSRVPFVVKPPKDVLVKPRVCDARVELVDFPATIYDLAGIDPGYTHFGRSLRPLLAGETDTHRDAVFCEGGRLAGEEHCKEAESLKTASRESGYWPRLAMQASNGPEHTKAIMCRTGRHKYVRRLYETDELYDLQNDPQEVVNRIGDPSLAGALAELKERLLTHYQETCDVVPHEADTR